MALQQKSSVLAFVREDTEGVLKDPVAAEFTAARAGFSFSGTLDSVESDELIDDIGASKPYTTKETPSASVPHYLKHSFVEGQEPDYGILIESALGGKTTVGVEATTIGGSTAGDSTTRAIIKSAGTFEKGQAVLIKDSTNGYAIRNIFATSGSDQTLNFNLGAAPGTGISLGLPILFKPASVGHPTFSAHHYQSSSGAGFHQAIAGCRTTGMTINLNANSLPEANFEIAGISFFYNPIRITAGVNDDIDWTDSVGTKTAAVAAGVYKTPKALAEAIQNAFSISDDTITVTYSSITGKFTIASDNTPFSILWNTGVNTATNIGSTIGFSTAADDTGASSYVADNALVFDPSVTPSFDAAEPSVVKNNELLLGDFFRTDCRKGSSFSLSMSTPKTDIDDWCAESGVSESATLQRQVTLSGVLLATKYEVDEMHALLQNTSVPFMFNHGVKSGGNWVPGKCINIYGANAALTANTITETDGVFFVSIEATCYVSSSQKDFYMNFL